MTAINSSCRYLVMAGGTGGHIFPALAVAKSLQERGASVSWLGTAGMESRIVPDHGIAFYSLSVKGFRGKGILQKLLAPLHLVRSIAQAVSIIKATDADVVVGFGGFVAAPGGIAAWLLGRTLVIHEQNSIAGTTNKMLSRLAKKTLTAFPNTLPGSAHVGNPIRQEISHLYQREKQQPSQNNFRILITGGSLGAKAINDVVPSAIAHLINSIKEKNAAITVEVFHQAGKGKDGAVIAAYKKLNVESTTQAFVEDIAPHYQWADIVICRAGALTVSEIATVGVPAIFIPLPSAIDNHQYHNAKWLVNHGASYLIEQKDLTDIVLGECLFEYATDHEKRLAMTSTLYELALPQATEEVTNYCEALCASPKKGANNAI